MSPTQIKLAIYAAVVLLLIGLGWHCARRQADFSGAKAEVKAQRKAAEQTKRSAEISQDTQKRVDTESANTRQRTERAVESIDATIDRSPAVQPGPADPDILRLAREAHQRAIAAHCRVQRTGDCPDAAAAP